MIQSVSHKLIVLFMKNTTFKGIYRNTKCKLTVHKHLYIAMSFSLYFIVEFTNKKEFFSLKLSFY